MKQLLCTLLAGFILLSLCSCADKKGKEDGEKKTAEETKTVAEEILTAPEQGDEGPTEIGTLPIIFGDEDEKKEDGNTPPTTTKKPPVSTTKAPDKDKDKDEDNDVPPLLGGSDGTVVETPIIPFN